MSFAGTYPQRRSAEKGGIVMYEIGYFPQNNKHLGKIGFQSQTHFITDKHEPIVTNEWTHTHTHRSTYTTLNNTNRTHTNTCPHTDQQTPLSPS